MRYKRYVHEAVHRKVTEVESKMKVLVAEGDNTSMVLLAETLRRWGYDVVTACDGKAAWQSLSEHNGPLLAIIDTDLSQMAGLEICRQLRKTPTTTPVYVLLLATKGTKEDVVAGLEAGANDYVVRPFDYDELRARLAVGRQVVELQKTLATRIKELEDAVAHIKHLHGVLPICCICKRIRDDEGAWNELESYITQHSDAGFSHGICPECRIEHYCECTKPEPKTAD